MKFDISVYKIVLLSSFALSVLVMSCSKLDEQPKSFVTPDKFYSTPGQIEASFADAMSSLWTAWTAYGYGMGNFSNDDQLNGGNLVISENWGSDLWGAHYNAVMNLNAAIAAMQKGNVKAISQSEMDVLMGQAKFLRAYNYFMLVRMFGGIPLITEKTPDPVNAKLKRASIEEVYQLIIADFTEAIAKLPSSWPPDHQGRPKADAARALLAKVYLTMATYPLNKPEYYQKAADMAWQVMQNPANSLITDISKVFTAANKYAPEMLWSFNSNYSNMATDPHIWTDMDGWGDFSADPIWVQKYPEQPRKYAYIQISSKTGQNYLTTGYLPGINKYLYDTQDDFDAGRSIINLPIIRFADVLLIYAEASNMAGGGPTQQAVDALNKVIDRANGYTPNAEDPLATTALSKDQFDSKVISERNYELCFEYDRWFDLVRKHILKQESNTNIQQNFSEDDYLFPIPSKDITLNPLLTQNPGY